MLGVWGWTQRNFCALYLALQNLEVFFRYLILAYFLKVFVLVVFLFQFEEYQNLLYWTAHKILNFSDPNRFDILFLFLD